jgi:hypothetical protein
MFDELSSSRWTAEGKVDEEKKWIKLLQ